MTVTSMSPNQVRADSLQTGSQIRHPHDWTLFTVVSVEALDLIGSPLDFHNRETGEMERGLRVTGVDDAGETVHVDCAPSYLWHREEQQPSEPEGAADPRYTQAGYVAVRKSWQDLIEMFGLTEYRARTLNAAYQLWALNAPEYAAGDDWTVAADKWQRIYLTNRTEWSA
ncbi:hypothetical protein ACFYPA_06210 [Streptomyces sp. NPDC005775]|uniref:hypothetical protein n=1 Tax=Streptomyces sp. NPDC005775 TaxID=3364729 RepID=UPI0036AC7F0E